MTFMLPATNFHVFKGMLEFTSVHGIMFLNSTSRCARIIVNSSYLNTVKFSVRIVSCFLLCVCKTITPVPSN